MPREIPNGRIYEFAKKDAHLSREACSDAYRPLYKPSMFGKANRITFLTCCNLDGHQQEISVRREVRNKTKPLVNKTPMEWAISHEDYQTAQTHVDIGSNMGVGISESTRKKDYLIVGVVAQGKLNVEQAESIAKQLHLLPE